MFIDPFYLVMVLIPGLLLGGLASLITKSTFSRYAKVRVDSGLTGAQAASRLLQSEGIHDVQIERTSGFLSDHYDPRSKTLRLSPAVYDTPSVSAVGVACHEAGHALQHAHAYGPLMMRSALVPAVQFGSYGAFIFILLGFFLRPFALLGIAVFALAFLFSLVTLPVEWDASARAKRHMLQAGIVSQQQQAGAASVLNAAFLTYVASAVTALLTLLYWLMRLGFLSDD